MDKKFEEEVPKILKSLGYPFTLSKSAMFAIGSLHTWPTILGALQWLVDCLRVCHFFGKVNKILILVYETKISFNPLRPGDNKTSYVLKQIRI